MTETERRVTVQPSGWITSCEKIFIGKMVKTSADGLERAHTSESPHLPDSMDSVFREPSWQKSLQLTEERL